MTHLTGFACPPVRRVSLSGAMYRKRSATQRAVKQTRPAVARGGPPGALRPLPDAWASRREPRLPGGPPRAIRWVIINAPWYYIRPDESRSDSI